MEIIVYIFSRQITCIYFAKAKRNGGRSQSHRVLNVRSVLLSSFVTLRGKSRDLRQAV